MSDITIAIIDPIAAGPVDWIPGFLPRKGELVIAGETNVGKSLVALEICSSLITNTPLWGELSPTFQAKRILYVLGEHYNEVIQRLWQLTGLPMTDQVRLLGPDRLGADKWLISNGKPNLPAIDKFKVWSEGADLIIFDPLSAFLTGADGENDNIQMRLVLDMMSGIAHSVGASCLVLAHQGKPMIDSKTGNEHTRTKYAIRGASAIEDAATNIFYLSPAEGESKAAKRIPSGVEIFSLKCRKYKGEAPDGYTLLRDPSTKRHVLLGDRPFVEAQREMTQAKFFRASQAVPGLGKADLVKILAAVHNVDEKTILNHLKG